MRNKALLFLLFIFTVTSNIAQITCKPSITHISCVGNTNGSITLSNIAGGIAPYTYTWQPGSVTSSSITSKPFGSYTLSVKGTGTVTSTYTYNIGYKTRWQNMYGSMTQSGDTLKHGTGSASWLYSGNSSNILSGSVNGWIEYVVTGTSQAKLFGLLDSASDSGWNNIDFGIMLNAGGTYNTCNNGTQASIGTYTIGDILRIERVGSSINYKKNNVSVWSTTVTPQMVQSRLTVRAAVYASGSTFENLGCSFQSVNAGIINTQTISCLVPMVNLTAFTNVKSPTYSWTPSGTASTSSVTGVSDIGTYTLKITEPYYGCFVNSTKIVSANRCKPAITHVSCVSGTNGSVVLNNVTGGISPYTYTWQPGATNGNSITAKGVGNYSLTVKETGSLTATYNFNIGYKTRWQNMYGSMTQSGDTLKHGAGSASWLYTGNSSNILSGSANGWIEYVVTGTSQAKLFGLLDSASASGWNNIDFGIMLNAGGTYNTCNNGTQASIGTYTIGDILRIERVGSSINYKKNNVSVWSTTVTPQMVQSRLTVRAGVYASGSTFENLGCSFPSLDANIKVSSPCAISSATLTALTNVAVPSYSWNPGGTSPTASVTTTSVAGTYSVKITEPYYGCNKTTSINVTIAPTLTITSSPTISLASPNVVLTSSTTSSGITYSWTPGGSSSSSYSTVVSNPGIYTLQVSNVAGCTSSTTVNITEKFEVYYDNNYVTFDEPNSGYISVTPKAAIGPCTYTWSTGSNDSYISDLAAGNYSLQVKDSVNRLYSTVFSIGQKEKYKNLDNVSIQDNVFYLEKAENGYGKATLSNIIKGGENGFVEFGINGEKTNLNFTFQQYETSPSNVVEGIRITKRNVRTSTFSDLSKIDYEIVPAIWPDSVKVTYREFVNLKLPDESRQILTNTHGVNIEGNKLYFIANGKTPYKAISISSGSKVKISRESNQFKVYVNNIEVQTESVSSSYRLMSSVSLFSNISEVMIHGGHFGGELTEPNDLCPSDITKNWSQKTIYDESGNITQESRSYSDFLGREVQIQNKNLTENMVIANQTIYDAFGRQVIKTLSAPTGINYFCYKSDFVMNTAGTAYTYHNFDHLNYSTNANALTIGEEDKPDALSTSIPWSLGWYYSKNNYIESYVPEAAHPYNISEFDKYNGSVGNKTAKAGADLNMGSGHEMKNFSMPTAGEMNYFYGYSKDYILSNLYTENGGTATFSDHNFNYKTTKTVTYDENGSERVAFYDNNGNQIAKAVAGDNNNQTPYLMHVTSFIKIGNGGTGYIDIHLPTGCQNTLVLQNSNPGTIQYTILDLIKGEYVKFSGSIYFSGQTPNLQAGVYRISCVSGNPINLLAVKYDLNYHDISLNYFDNANRLKVSIPPNGYDYGYTPSFTSVSNAYNYQNVGSIAANYAVGQPTSTETQFTQLRLVVSKKIPGGGGGGGPFFERISYDYDPFISQQGYIQRLSGQQNFSSEQSPQNIISTGNIGDGWDVQQVIPGDGEGGDPNNPDIIVRHNHYKINYNIEKADASVITPGYIIANRVDIFDSYTLNLLSSNWFFTAPVNHLVNPQISATTGGVQLFVTAINLYKYDGAGLLLFAGADDGGSADLQMDVAINTQKFTGAPNHTFRETYEYNTWGSLLTKNTVDQGKTDYVYSKDQKIKFSQNAKQKLSGSFNYYLYDRTNRATEKGEYDPTGATIPFVFQSYADNKLYPSIANTVHGLLENNLVFSSTNCKDKVNTQYDLLDVNFASLTGLSPTNYKQDFTSGLISKSYNDKHTTWFGYDEFQRIKWTVQRFENMPTTGQYTVKTQNYTYDIFGNILSNEYQKENASERLIQSYVYDKDKRLKTMYSSFDGINKEEQASYKYYLHGPLKRKEIGGKVQGIDFVYTINGWLKSMNSAELNDRDPGKDGYSNNQYHTPKDLFGFNLDYFEHDYIRENSNIQNFTADNRNFYNGNIKDIRWKSLFSNNIGITHNTNELMYQYSYDENSQLTDAVFGEITNQGTINNSSGSTSGPVFSSSNDYKVSGISYDKNGNILTLNRNSYATSTFGLGMDNFTYSYNTGTNKLNNVTDLIAGAHYDNEISNTQTNNNYQYDGLGQLERDISKNQYYSYNSLGMVTGIYNDVAKTSPKVLYTYDETGKRLKKTSYTPTNPGTLIKDTWYVREVSGRVISIYEKDNITNTIAQKESYINGISKIGTYDKLTNKFIYELTDNVGNIRSTFSKVGVNSFCSNFDNLGQWDYLFNYNSSQIDNTVDISGSTGSSCLTEFPTKQYGHGVSLKVYPGQQINASVFTKYYGLLTPNTTLAFSLTDKYGNIVGWHSPSTAGLAGSWNQFNLSYQIPTNLGSDLTLFIFPFNVDADGIKVWYDNLCINIINNGNPSSVYIPSQLNTSDYYPHGGLIPGRNYIANTGNRYNYQGKEKDELTGLSDFEARLWDDQLGRWLVPDPASQFVSPYIGMGNNPVSKVDFDGRWIWDGQHLYAQKGDNALTLYVYYNSLYPFSMTPEQAKAQYNNLNNWDGGTGASWQGSIEGHYLTLSPIEHVSYVNVADVNAQRGDLYGMPYIPSAAQQGVYNAMDQFGKGMLVGSFAIVAAPLLIEAAPLLAAEGSLIWSEGGAALKSTIVGSGMWSTSEIYWSTKAGGALADFTTQMIGKDPYNVSSTLLELNPYTNPFTSAVIQGYGGEFLKYEYYGGYKGIFTEGFKWNDAIRQADYNTGANLLGDMPGGKMEQFNMGQSFDFMNSFMFNSGANVLTPQVGKNGF